VTIWWKFWNFVRNKPKDDYCDYVPPRMDVLVTKWDEQGELLDASQVITEQPKGKQSKGKEREIPIQESAVRTACTTVAHKSVFPIMDEIQGVEMHLGTLTWTPGKLHTLNHVTTNPHPHFLVFGPQGMEKVRLDRPDAAFGPQGERIHTWRVDKLLEEKLRAAGYTPLNPKVCPEKGKCQVLYSRESGLIEGDGGEFITDKHDPNFAEARYQSHAKYSGGAVVEGQLDEMVYKGSKHHIGDHARGGKAGASNFFLRNTPEIVRCLQLQGKMRSACNGHKCTCTFEELTDITVGPSEARLGAQLAQSGQGAFRLAHPNKKGGNKKQSAVKTSPKQPSASQGKSGSQRKGSGNTQESSQSSPASGATDTGTQSQSSSAQ
jgi:hypothetical protein